MNQYMDLIGKNARKASLGKINTKIKNKVLKKYILLIDKEKNLILKENAKDIKFSFKKKLKNNLIDRLVLNHKKLNIIKNSIKKIIKLKDPIDNTLEKWKRPNGLKISKVSIPIGTARNINPPGFKMLFIFCIASISPFGFKGSPYLPSPSCSNDDIERQISNFLLNSISG